MDLAAPEANRTITRTGGNLGNGDGYSSCARGTPGETAHCCGAAGSDACGIVRIFISWSLYLD